MPMCSLASAPAARSGGSWHLTEKSAEGEYSFCGSYHEVAKNERIWTFEFLGMPERGHVALERMDLVRIDDNTLHEPDALVRCGPPLPGDAIEASDPVIVVEVVSPSSRGIDKGAKLASYFSPPSVRHYLIVDTEKRVVIHHHLVEDGRIESRFLRNGPLALDPPGLTIEVRDIFAGL